MDQSTLVTVLFVLALVTWAWLQLNEPNQLEVTQDLQPKTPPKPPEPESDNLFADFKLREQWIQDQNNIYQLVLHLEQQAKQENPDYICRVGRISDFHPLKPRFALVEEVLTDQSGIDPYIIEYCVDCLMVEKLVEQGSLVLFHYAGAEVNECGNEVQYGIAVSVLDKKQDERMLQAWMRLYHKANNDRLPLQIAF